MRIWAKAGILAFGLCASLVAAQTTRSIAACRIGDLEVYQADSGMEGSGFGAMVVALRNISERVCSLKGVPRLEFFNGKGQSARIPYGRIASDYTFKREPVRRVMLETGGFAHFILQTNVGDQSLRYHWMRVLLPGDTTPFAVNVPGDYAFHEVNVSAVVAGKPAELTRPTKAIGITKNSLNGWASEAYVPARPTGPFEVHLTLRNTAGVAQRLDAAQCSVTEKVTNSAGKSVRNNGRCGAWSGEIDMNGTVRPGARVTADFDAGEVAEQLCRVGNWLDEIDIATSVGDVAMARFPFRVGSTDCSDSQHVGEPMDTSTIRWSGIAEHGVRVGVAVRGMNGAAPTMEIDSENNQKLKKATFHQDDTIELGVYVDNLTDEPLRFNSGADAFRIVVNPFGNGRKLPETHNIPTSVEGKIITVLPHTWMYVETLRLNDLYSLAPGAYSVVVAPQNFTGKFATANSPAQGLPYTEDSVPTTTFVKIVR